MKTPSKKPFYGREWLFVKLLNYLEHKTAYVATLGASDDNPSLSESQSAGTFSCSSTSSKPDPDSREETINTNKNSGNNHNNNKHVNSSAKSGRNGYIESDPVHIDSTAHLPPAQLISGECAAPNSRFAHQLSPKKLLGSPSEAEYSSHRNNKHHQSPDISSENSRSSGKFSPNDNKCPNMQISNSKIHKRHSCKRALSSACVPLGSVPGILLVGGPGSGKTALCEEILQPSVVISPQMELNARLLVPPVFGQSQSSGCPYLWGVGSFISEFALGLTQCPALEHSDVASRLTQDSALSWLSDPVKCAMYPNAAFSTILKILNTIPPPPAALFLLIDSLHEGSTPESLTRLRRLFKTNSKAECLSIADDDDDGSSHITLVELICAHYSAFPPWLLIVCTTRKQWPGYACLTKLLPGFRKVTLDDWQRSAVVRDAQHYILSRLDDDATLRDALCNSHDSPEMLSLLSVKSNACILYLERPGYACLTKLLPGFRKVTLDDWQRSAVVRDAQHYILSRLDDDATLRDALCNSHDSPEMLSLLSVKSNACILYLERPGYACLTKLLPGFRKVTLDDWQRSAVVRDAQHYILSRLDDDATLRDALCNSHDSPEMLSLLSVKSNACILYLERPGYACLTKLLPGFRKVILDDWQRSAVVRDAQHYILCRLDDDATLRDALCNSHDSPEMLSLLSVKSNACILYLERPGYACLTKLLPGFRKVTLDDWQRSAVVRDAQHYILSRLDDDATLRDALCNSHDSPEMLSLLSVKSNACILYLERVLDGILNGYIRLHEIPNIPGTLAGLYLWLCHRIVPRGNAFPHSIRPLLNILLAAVQPLSRSQLYDALWTTNMTLTQENFSATLKLIDKFLVFSPSQTINFKKSPKSMKCQAEPTSAPKSSPFDEALEILDSASQLGFSSSYDPSNVDIEKTADNHSIITSSPKCVHPNEPYYAKILRKSSSLRKVNTEDELLVNLFHNSFAEWLCDVKYATQRYLCNPTAGHAAISMWLCVQGSQLTEQGVILLQQHLEKAHIYSEISDPSVNLVGERSALLRAWMAYCGIDCRQSLASALPSNNTKIIGTNLGQGCGNKDDIRRSTKNRKSFRSKRNDNGRVRNEDNNQIVTKHISNTDASEMSENSEISNNVPQIESNVPRKCVNSGTQDLPSPTETEVVHKFLRSLTLDSVSDAYSLNFKDALSSATYQVNEIVESKCNNGRTYDTATAESSYENCLGSPRSSRQPNGDSCRVDTQHCPMDTHNYKVGTRVSHSHRPQEIESDLVSPKAIRSGSQARESPHLSTAMATCSTLHSQTSSHMDCGAGDSLISDHRPGSKLGPGRWHCSSGSSTPLSVSHIVQHYQQSHPVERSPSAGLAPGSRHALEHVEPIRADYSDVKHQAEVALLHAAREGDGQTCCRLLKAGVSTDQADAEGWSPLRGAAMAGHSDVVESLLSYGAGVDWADHSGRTALRAAAWAGHDSIVRMLLAHGAKPNKTDDSGRTAIMAAAYMGHWNIVMKLLDAGADPRSVDTDGQSALTLAVIGSNASSDVDSDAVQRQSKDARLTYSSIDYAEQYHLRIIELLLERTNSGKGSQERGH